MPQNSISHLFVRTKFEDLDIKFDSKLKKSENEVDTRLNQISESLRNNDLKFPEIPKEPLWKRITIFRKMCELFQKIKIFTLNLFKRRI